MSERRTLESWKAIAAYLGRTEKTCRKWEHELGLPIHRLDDSAKAHVFAYVDELDLWKEEKLQGDKARKSGGIFGFAGLSRISPRTRTWLAAASALAVIVLSGYLVRRFTLRDERPARTPKVQSVAVLPFADLSPSKDYEYLCDGMVETLINALNKIEGLRVPARASSFYFKGKDLPPQEIGKKLNVDYLLEASVQVEGERLRVIPRLTKVADGYQVWSEKYDRRREDIFAVQDDIARRVVDGLKVKVLGNETAPLVKAGTANIEAHNLYLQGRYLQSKGGFESILNAVKCYEKAVDLDPHYALGFAGLSSAYYTLGNNLFAEPRETFPKARAYAVKALEFDESLADAHRALGQVKEDYDWDFGGAESEYTRAMELNPGDGYTRQAYASHLTNFGKHEEAIKEIRLARDLDPLALRIRANVALTLFYARKYAEAEQVCREELEFEPRNCAVYAYLARIYRETSRFDLAIENMRKGDECLRPGLVEIDPLFAAMTYARMGKQEEARRIIRTVESSSIKGIYWSPVNLAAVQGWLGDKDKAFSLLERAFAERDPRLIRLKSEPFLDCLRDDPRFGDFLRRIGLEK